ncbi:alpha/beta fold hydrolase [Glaciibacter sp. 2TAF33]|uniref:alpha/beta fold hydrolase n=1 Tax=Glaciibacter sp. 2TAF33 TaxID=3233015 RepID=UPI003F901BC8
MDIILVPGFWLQASSWAKTTPSLRAAGHRVHPLTLPGLEDADAPRAGIGLQDHVDAVVKAIDAIDERVVLVGHSGGGAIIYGALDARPDWVERMVYVDCVPAGEGDSVFGGQPPDGADLPMPPWEEFDDADLTDLDDELRAELRAHALPEPRDVAYGKLHLHDERRLGVPSTVIACEYPASQLLSWIAEGQPYAAELARLHDVEYVDLPTGHWPQFTKPAELGDAILAAVERTR